MHLTMNPDAWLFGALEVFIVVGSIWAALFYNGE